MKKNVFLAVTLLAFIAVGAFAQSESDFKVTKTATEVTITGYTGSATVVNIPARIQNLPVTTIGKDAFKSSTKITSVTIPDSVTTIEDQAFLGCAALTSVTISERATKMGQDVFAYCPNLTSVTFRGNFLAFEARIGVYAFNRLGDLREKYIEGNYGTYTRPNNTSTTWTRQATPAATVAPAAAAWTAVADSKVGTSQIMAIAYGNNTFVAGGEAGKMAVSPDGVTWTAVADSKFGNSTILGIAYYNGKFYAVGNDGKIAHSGADGKTWTIADHPFAATSQIRAIALDTNKFMLVAVSHDGKMAYSDARYSNSWTAVADTKLGGVAIFGIAYGNNKFVAGGTNGKMATSADGRTWTAVADSKLGASQIMTIVWGGNKFVAGTADGKIAYSADGVTWTLVANSTFKSTIRSIAYGNNKFVAVAQDSTMATSPDGVTWTAVANRPLTVALFAIGFGNNKFVAGGQGGKMATGN